MTQQEIADRQGVTRGMIWLIEKRALRKMRDAIERFASREGKTPQEWLFGDVIAKAKKEVR